MAPYAIRTLTLRSLSGHRRRLINIGRATRLQACVRPACLGSTSGRFHGELLHLLFLLADRKATRYFEALGLALARPSMLTLMFTAGVGVGISGACGPPWVWRARKPLPCALRSSAAFALGLERRRATVPENRLPFLGLCLRPHWLSPCFSFLCLCSFCLCV